MTRLDKSMMDFMVYNLSAVYGRYLNVTRVTDPTLPGPEISVFLVPDPIY